MLERRCRPPAFKQIGTFSKRGLLGVSKWVADVADMIATVAGLLDLCMQTVCRACGFVTVTYCMCRWAPCVLSLVVAIQACLDKSSGGMLFAVHGRCLSGAGLSWLCGSYTTTIRMLHNSNTSWRELNGMS